MPTNFCLITDTHYYNADALGLAAEHQQKTLNESGAILDAALDTFLARDGCDVLLIAGDITCNGERESHEELVRKLRRVQAAGKRVLLITSTHDYEQENNARKLAEGRPIALMLTVTGEFNPGVMRRDELRGTYDEFGFADAISVYDELSYCAQIAPGLRVLMLNDDGDGRSFCGYYPAQLEWILAQLADAKAAGDAIFAVTHHPLLPPFPLYPNISKRDMLGGFETTRDILADAGLRVIFTGHTHIHNIGAHTSAAGNTITDVNTAALCGYPAPMRLCSFDDGVLDIHTETVQDFAWDLGGLTAQEYLRDVFDHLVRNVIRCAAHDFEGFAKECNGFSVQREQIVGYKLPIKLLGHFLEHATLGTLGTLLLCRGKLPKEARRVKLDDLITEVMRNIYAGTENYSPETPVGKAVQILAGRLQKLVGKRLRGSIAEDLPEFFGALLYDDSPDWEWRGAL
ncbi:MAG: metallophosphoesterase [Oscillospiraceae bacterium]|jgi:predicted phosphodiesterase|nr:metallophosphoesterase [Oscillospiraceae bacterium]